MGLFKRDPPPEPKSLDELVGIAKGFVEETRCSLEPDEDYIPSVLTDGKKGTTINALALPGPELERTVNKLARKADRAVFWYTAWQVEGVPEGTVPSEHPDRFEAVCIQAAEPAANREEFWRAKLTRHPHSAPTLAPWERLG